MHLQSSVGPGRKAQIWDTSGDILAGDGAGVIPLVGGVSFPETAGCRRMDALAWDGGERVPSSTGHIPVPSK